MTDGLAMKHYEDTQWMRDLIRPVTKEVPMAKDPRGPSCYGKTKSCPATIPPCWHPRCTFDPKEHYEECRTWIAKKAYAAYVVLSWVPPTPWDDLPKRVVDAWKIAMMSLKPSTEETYAVYCKEMGGKAYDGWTLQTWDEMPERFRAKWQAAHDAAFRASLTPNERT